MRSVPAVTGAGLRAAEAREGARPFPDSGHCGLLLPFGNQHRLSVSLFCDLGNLNRSFPGFSLSGRSFTVTRRRLQNTVLNHPLYKVLVYG